MSEKTGAPLYDREERRRWCIEQATKAFGLPSMTASELTDRAKVIETWLLENPPALLAMDIPDANPGRSTQSI